jgi:rod shape-determining protein MreB and related proteins
MLDLSNLFNYDIAIDPGSYKVRAFDSSASGIISTPTFLGYSHVNKTPIAFGEEAKSMIGKIPKGMEVIKPIQFSEIVTNDYFEIFLKHVFEELNKKNQKFRLKTKPRVYIPLPIDFTQSSLTNFENSILKAGASEVVFLKKLVCSSYGVTKDLADNKVKMVVDIGYQKTEFGVVFKNEIYEGRVLNFGGEVLDRVILNKLVEDKKIQCSLNNVEKYKEECLSFLPFPTENEKFKIIGKDIKKGTPVTAEISFLDLREYLVPTIRTELVKQIKAFLNSLTDNIISDLYEDGIYLVGGTALNPSLAAFLSKEVGIKFNFLKNAEHAQINGIKKLLQKNLVDITKIK